MQRGPNGFREQVSDALEKSPGVSSQGPAEVLSGAGLEWERTWEVHSRPPGPEN